MMNIPNHDTIEHQTQLLTRMHHKIRECRLCLDQTNRSLNNPVLPHEPNPVVVPSASARVAICGQAPGIRVHKSGRPFTDPSGDRLRAWMGVNENQFYDSKKIAIIPMGFCFPGFDKRGSDLPPRRECKAYWHDKLFAAMPNIELILAIGIYAQNYHLGSRVKKNLTETVKAWRDYIDPYQDKSYGILPMPHPSWRNTGWLKKNPYFEQEILPYLRKKVLDLS